MSEKEIFVCRECNLNCKVVAEIAIEGDWPHFCPFGVLPTGGYQKEPLFKKRVKKGVTIQTNPPSAGVVRSTPAKVSRGPVHRIGKIPALIMSMKKGGMTGKGNRAMKHSEQ
jgi:hypothetical protein